MNETERVIKLANSVLDDPSRDPDSNASVLARQFLRALEQLAKFESVANKERRINSPGFWAYVMTWILVFLLAAFSGSCMAWWPDCGFLYFHNWIFN